MQRDLADLIHKHSQLSAYCDRLKHRDASMQSHQHAARQNQSVIKVRSVGPMSADRKSITIDYSVHTMMLCCGTSPVGEVQKF